MVWRCTSSRGWAVNGGSPIFSLGLRQLVARSTSERHLGLLVSTRRLCAVYWPGPRSLMARRTGGTNRRLSSDPDRIPEIQLVAPAAWGPSSRGALVSGQGCGGVVMRSRDERSCCEGAGRARQGGLGVPMIPRQGFCLPGATSPRIRHVLRTEGPWVLWLKMRRRLRTTPVSVTRLPELIQGLRGPSCPCRFGGGRAPKSRWSSRSTTTFLLLIIASQFCRAI